MIWRILPLERAAAAALVERSMLLFEQLAADPVATVRPYVATDRAVVLGRGQPPVAGALQRPSGGGAVMMDGDLLNVDLAIPAGHELLGSPHDLGAVFEGVGAAWARALQHLDVPDVAVHRSSPPTRFEICFAALGRGEVTARGRKLVGLAQRRRRPGALIQCGVLKRWAPAPLLTALGRDPDDAAVHQGAVGLDDLVDQPPSDDALIAALARHLG